MPLTDTEILHGLMSIGLPEPQSEEERKVVVEVVRALEKPRFCGVSEHLNIGGQQFGTWPETTLTFNIHGDHPGVAPPTWRRMIENALDEYHSVFAIDFVETDNPGEGVCHLLFTVANLGGAGGVLADAMLVPFGIRDNDDFRSTIRADRNDNFVEEVTGAVMEIVGPTVLKHELGHSMGAPHHSVPNSLLNPIYNPAISSLQPADIELLVKLGLPRRVAPLPPPPSPLPPPGEPTLGRMGTRVLRAGQVFKSNKRSWVIEEL